MAMKQLAIVIVGGVALASLMLSRTPSAASDDVDTAFRRFWDARSREEAAKAVPDVLKSGVTLDDALKRLKAGRPYSPSAARGVLKFSYTARAKEFFYAVNVPDSYDPARRYQVRIQLHGGVSRESNRPRGDGSIGPLAGADQIYILPTSWVDAMWWTPIQLENLDSILDSVKRSYNVDENRVVVSGVSDGGTGAYYIAMKDTTPYASFLPLNGYILVLRSPDLDVGDVFPTNLRNKPFFVVNGGKDPLYPASIVGPSVLHLKGNGVDLVYKPQPNGVHNTAWWPEVRDSFEEFVKNHPRSPIPERLTWESGGSSVDNRAHWLVIDRLAAPDRTLPKLDDVNLLNAGGPRMFEHTRASGRVDLVRSGNTVAAETRGVGEFTLLISPDAFDLAAPLKVVANGRTVFDGRVDASLPTLMKWAARDNDRTMLFAAEVHIKIS
jgi:hypothetical protein